MSTEQVPLSEITTNIAFTRTQDEHEHSTSSDEREQMIISSGNPTLEAVQALDTKPASILSSCYNLSNTAVGAGILTLPYATAQVGWGLGLLLFIGGAILTAFELHIHAMVAKLYRPKSSYKVLCDATAKYLSLFVDFIVALNTFGACCAYLIIVGDLLPDIVRHFGDDYDPVLYERRFWIMLYFVVFLLPCLYWRKLDALRYVSAFGMVCYIYITILIVAYAIIGVEGKGNISAKPLAPLNFFKVLPKFIFAYVCIMNIMPIVNELETCSRTNINIIANCSMLFVFALYISMGFAGYFTYGDNSSDNIITAYPTDLPEFLIARVLLSFCVTFSYPVLFNPCRHCLASLFCCAENANKGKLSNAKFIGITTFIWMLTIVVSMTVTDLGYVVAVDGAIAGIVMMMVLPGVYYCFIEDRKKLEKDPWYTFKKWLSFILMVIGCFLTPFCVAMIFVEV